MKLKSKLLTHSTTKQKKLNTNKRLSAKNAEKDDHFKYNKLSHLDLINEDVWDFMNDQVDIKDLL